MSYSIAETGLDAVDDDNRDSLRSRVTARTSFRSTTINRRRQRQPHHRPDVGRHRSVHDSAAIRFVAIDASKLARQSPSTISSINFTTVSVNTAGDTLNGGLGDDTYSFTLGDGNDVINEAVQQPGRHGGSHLDPGAEHRDRSVDGLPIRTITALNAIDSNTGTTDGDLVINYTLPTGTAADHHRGRALHRHQCPDRRRAHQLQRRHLRRLPLGADDYLDQPAGSDQPR